MTKIMLKGRIVEHDVSEQGVGLLSFETLNPYWYIEVTEL